MTEERMTKVVVGKVHISNWAKDEFRSRIVTLLRTKKKYEQRKGKGAREYFWVFSDFIDTDIDADDKMLFARLVRIKKQTKETVFDEEKWSPERMERDSPNASFSNFAIFLKNHVILFEERSTIPINLFMQMFSVMYAQLLSAIDMSSMWIDPLVDKSDILLRLKKFDKVTDMQFVLAPSNPDTGDYKTLDDLFKGSKAAKVNLNLSNPEGLRVEGQLINEAMNLAYSGHGSAEKIIAKRGDKEEEIQPKNAIKRLHVPYSDNAGEFAENLTQLYISSTHGGGKL